MPTREYDFIPFDYTSQEHDHTYWDKIEDDLKLLLKNSNFIVSNYRTMWPISAFKGVEDSHRGPTVEFTDGLMTYWYNIIGGYKIDRDEPKKEQPKPVGFY